MYHNLYCSRIKPFLRDRKKWLRISLFVCKSLFVSFQRTPISSDQGNQSNDPIPWKKNFLDPRKLIIKGFNTGFYSFLEQKDKYQIDSSCSCKGNTYYASPNHDLHQLGFFFSRKNCDLQRWERKIPNKKIETEETTRVKTSREIRLDDKLLMVSVMVFIRQE
jgi:hypothetical protein